MSFPERQNCESYAKEKAKKSCWDFLQHCCIYILRQLPWKAASLERRRAERQKSAQIHQVRMQMSTWKVIQNERSRGSRWNRWQNWTMALVFVQATVSNQILKITPLWSQSTHLPQQRGIPNLAAAPTLYNTTSIQSLHAPIFNHSWAIHSLPVPKPLGLFRRVELGQQLFCCGPTSLERLLGSRQQKIQRQSRKDINV